jgi:hypothetical protein
MSLLGEGFRANEGQSATLDLTWIYKCTLGWTDKSVN